MVDNVRIYTSQNAFMPSLSLSILYLTVLSFAGQMVTYMLAVGYTSTIVGIVRVGSSVCEMSPTWIAPWVLGKVGPRPSWNLVSESSDDLSGHRRVRILDTPSPYLGSSLGLPSAGSACGASISRLRSLSRKEVQPEYRGAFSTTKATLQNFFKLYAYASTIMFFRPVDFKYPATISIDAVYIAGGLYTKFVRDRRGHLLHASHCVKSRDRSRQMYHHVSQDIGEELV
jgi:solute carrier family 40 (iron-regulated transporter), member 1